MYVGFADDFAEASIATVFRVRLTHILGNYTYLLAQCVPLGIVNVISADISN
jgi:hypothetical protein